MRFANYLQRIRSEKELTQQSLLELLINSDKSFSKLDLTTLSRWERGVTTPKLEKQIIIARLMNDDIAHLLDPEADIPQSKKNTLDKLIKKINNPYAENNLPFHLTKLDSLKEEPVFIKKLQEFHNFYLGIEINDHFFSENKLYADLYINDKEELIGHLFYGYISVEDSIPLLESDTCNFINELSSDEETILYIMSAYSSLSKPRTIIILSILDLLRKNTSIKTACINCHDQDGFNLYDKMSSIEILNKGEEVEFGGIKLFGKRYRYVQILVNIESILASKVMADLIPFTCKYIEDLLQEQKLKNDS